MGSSCCVALAAEAITKMLYELVEPVCRSKISACEALGASQVDHIMDALCFVLGFCGLMMMMMMMMIDDDDDDGRLIFSTKNKEAPGLLFLLLDILLSG